MKITYCTIFRGGTVSLTNRRTKMEDAVVLIRFVGVLITLVNIIALLIMWGAHNSRKDFNERLKAANIESGGDGHTNVMFK